MESIWIKKTFGDANDVDSVCRFKNIKTRPYSYQIRVIYPTLLYKSHAVSWNMMVSRTLLIISDQNSFVFGVFLVRISPHLDWIRRDTEYLSVFRPNARKYRPESPRIRIIFTHCNYSHMCIMLSIWIQTIIKTSICIISRLPMPAIITISKYRY